jgi:hypothetical protein
VDAKETIGIYITGCSATVAALAPGGKDLKVVDCFTVTVDNPQGSSLDNIDTAAQLAERIAQGCSQRSIAFQNGTVAVDSSMFMQHTVHSEFADAKQIAQTVRFDAEESLATDINDLAIAFQIASQTPQGSNLSVFTAQRKLLGNILSALTNIHIDPVFIEPDIICLSRFIVRQFPQNPSQVRLFAVLSSSSGYLIVPSASDPAFSGVLRTFLVGSAQDRFALLKSQITVTSAMLPPDCKIDSLAVFDSSGSIETGRLFETVGIKTESVDLTVRIIPEASLTRPADDAPSQQVSVDKVSLAIAAGAALAFDDKIKVDFRADFSPYQGKKVKFEKTLKIVSVCAAICLLALGILAQTAQVKVNKPRKLERRKFNDDYMLVMGTNKVNKNLNVAVEQLKQEHRRLQRLNLGFSDEGKKTIPDKFAALLRAFNACADSVKLEIQSVDITSRTIHITGSTANEAGTRRLREAIEQNNLVIGREELLDKGGRHNFSMTVEAK